MAGNLEEEEKVLKWLENQQKTDEIEDITDEMLDMIIEKMSHVAVLFCKFSSELSITLIEVWFYNSRHLGIGM